MNISWARCEHLVHHQCHNHHVAAHHIPVDGEFGISECVVLKLCESTLFIHADLDLSEDLMTMLLTTMTGRTTTKWIRFDMLSLLLLPFFFLSFSLSSFEYFVASSPCSACKVPMSMFDDLNLTPFEANEANHNVLCTSHECHFT